MIMSNDTYLLRTSKRDTDYELIYKVRGNLINGKRLHAGTYIRNYID